MNNSMYIMESLNEENVEKQRALDRERKRRKRAMQKETETEEEKESRRKKERARQSRMRSSQMEQEKEEKKKWRNALLRGKRANESSSGRKARCEARRESEEGSAAERAAIYAWKQADMKVIRAKKQAGQNLLEVTPQEFFAALHEDSDCYFGTDWENEPLEAAMLWYINSGIDCFVGVGVPNLEDIVDEIRGEELTAEERKHIIEKFFHACLFGEGALLSCGACGIWKQSRENGFKYFEQELSKLPHGMRLNEADRKAFEFNKEAILEAPTSVARVSKTINLGKVHSWYESRALVESSTTGDHEVFYLHPELIHHDENSIIEKTWMCELCWEWLKKQAKKQDDNLWQPPPLSIANGIDFGWYEHLGLERPSLLEQAIIARAWRYMQFMKVKLNEGSRTDYTMQQIQSHAILFEHDTPNIAKCCFDKEHMKRALTFVFVDPEGKLIHFLQQRLINCLSRVAVVSSVARNQ